MGEHLFIRGGCWQFGLQALNLVTMADEDLTDLAWHIMIEEKPHAPDGAVCAKASFSISSRWSS